MTSIWALVRDTVQEARARWLFWGLFSLSSLLVGIFLFALNVDLVAGAQVTVGMGGRTRTVYDIHKFVNVAYSWVSLALYYWGTMLAVFASAGLIPVQLEPGRIALLLSKPVTRSALILGRYVGNVLIILFNNSYLILAIWLILGIKTGVWEGRFLLAIPISVFMFAVLLCLVTMVGVVFESAALAVMCSMATVLISALLAQREWSVRLLSSEWSRQLWNALYWIVPKVYDLGVAMKQIILYDRQADLFTPIWTSALFAAGVLWASLVIFKRRDF